MDMENWDDSVEEIKKKSQIFALFFHDDNQSQTNNFKRTLNDCVEDKHQPFEDTIDSFLKIYDEPLSNKQTFQNEQRQLEVQKIQERTETEERSKKQPKSGLYSKNYREKKKQRVKILEEQNLFLKKKVDQLQLRLREKQMQINRLKFTSNEQYDISQLNEEIMTRLKIISQPDSSNKNEPEKQDNVVKDGDKKIQQFLKMFDTYGFGGTKAIELLEYYINEYLENVMRDRQKYYFLYWAYKRYLNPQKRPLDIALEEAYLQTEEQKQESIKLSMQIRPVTMDLLFACREMHHGHQKVVKSLQKIHVMARVQLTKNIEYTQKRMKMVMWFQANRYRKQMRQIRAQWIDLVKSQDEPWVQKSTNTKRKIIK